MKDLHHLNDVHQICAFEWKHTNGIEFIIIKDINSHSMKEALYKYLEIKIHSTIFSFSGHTIIIRPKYKRKKNTISKNEKTDKLFNWKRPTAELARNGKILYLNCFPGESYIRHYASIVSSFLSFRKKQNVNIIPIAPKAVDSLNALLSSNIHDVPLCSTIIVGAVEKFLDLTGRDPWKGEGDFCWSAGSIGREKIVLLGCKFSFWGDIAGNLVRLLAEKGVKNFIYVGKVGGLKEHMKPNITLATGTKSVLNGREIHWKSSLHIPPSMEEIVYGTHFTLPSILEETDIWLNELSDEYCFVDPEIGWIADAANKSGISFGYIHVVSDNVRKNHHENLSNERETRVLQKRQAAIQKILKILKLSLLELHRTIPHRINKTILQFVPEKLALTLRKLNQDPLDFLITDNSFIFLEFEDISANITFLVQKFLKKKGSVKKNVLVLQDDTYAIAFLCNSFLRYYSLSHNKICFDSYVPSIPSTSSSSENNQETNSRKLYPFMSSHSFFYFKENVTTCKSNKKANCPEKKSSFTFLKKK